MLQIIFVFLLWLIVLYWLHRFAHVVPYFKKIHWAHHDYIFKTKGNLWNWKILLLFNDDWPSTIDTWLIEVTPTIVIAWLTNSWWLLVFFYIWAAFIQEFIEHNPKINFYPIITSGKWHLEHHKNHRYNYGLFTSIFDIIFGTNKDVRRT